MTLYDWSCFPKPDRTRRQEPSFEPAGQSLENWNMDEGHASLSVLHAVIEGTNDAIFVKDETGRYLLVNSACANFLGLSAEEIIGQRDEDLYQPETARQFREHDQHVLSTGETQVFEGVASARGVNQVYLVTKSAYRNREGKIIGLIGISHDITERKRAEEQRIVLIREQEARRRAEDSNRLKDEFLAMLSHELRTPITAILGWARLLQTNKFNEERRRHAVETIERSARAQTQLIDDLLDVSRIITGKLRLDMNDVDLAYAVNAAIDAVGPKLKAKHIQLETELDGEPLLVAGDFNRLQQVVWNLLTNAVKFTPDGGRLSVRLVRAGGGSHAELSVSDSGQGISPEFLPYVFERFKQADQTAARSHGGLGLGLAIVRHIVELHGGNVRAESGGEGQGAKFTVNIPLLKNTVGEKLERRRLQSDAAYSTGNTAHLRGLLVLAVDDENDTLEIVRETLVGHEARVICATSASEALSVLATHKPDAFISDIGMPGEDGYSLIARVRALPKSEGGNTPAAALTAYAREEDRIRALMAGFQIHLPKPINPAELVAVVLNLTGRAGTLPQ